MFDPKICDPKIWAQVPFHFWTFCIFLLGCIVGSFLNVCIYRLPREESVVRPPSHCPHCGYSIPWYLNIPLVTWLWLRGECANCKAPISMRYFVVELLTGTVFACCWMSFGAFSPALALVYCLFIAGLIAATFIDFEHFIIPDEITFGGMAAGIFCSFLVPALQFKVPLFQRATVPAQSMPLSFLGMAAGGGVIYGILRLGKWLFGRQRVDLPPATQIYFTETSIRLPGEEILYEAVFYRKSDTVEVEARHIEMVDRCYIAAEVRLRPDRLQIGQDTFDPEKVMHLEMAADRLILPREAMGLGDVKFMAAIGAFLGWPAVFFCLALSSCIGSFVGICLIVSRKQDWSSRIPYGPYIAVAAVVWIFGGYEWLKHLVLR